MPCLCTHQAGIPLQQKSGHVLQRPYLRSRKRNVNRVSRAWEIGLQWTPLSLSGQWEVICTWQELSALSVKLHWVALNPKWTFESGKYNTIHS